MKTTGRYATEVIADSSDKFFGNAVRFDTVKEARDYVVDLGWRWMAVRACRVVDTENENQPVWNGS